MQLLLGQYSSYFSLPLPTLLLGFWNIVDHHQIVIKVNNANLSPDAAVMGFKAAFFIDTQPKRA